MAYTAAEQATAASRVRPLLWARLSVNHTKKTCALSLVPPLAALVIILVSGALSLDTPDNMDYAVRNDLRTRLDDARTAAQAAFRYVPPGSPDDGSVRERSQTDPELTLSILYRGRVGPDGEIGVLDETSNSASNVLSREGVALIKKAEDALLQRDGFEQFCLSDPQARDCDGNVPTCAMPQSLLNSEHLYGQYTTDNALCGRKPGADIPSESQWRNFLNSLYTTDPDGNEVLNGTFSRYLGLDFSKEDNQTWIVKSVFPMGEPFPGFKTPEDRDGEQSDKFKDWAGEADDAIEAFTTPTTEVTLVSFALLDAAFSSIAFRDLAFSIGSIILVFLIIWLHTTSMFLAATSLVQIFLAFPYAYFAYYYIVQQRYFASLQLLVIFLVLGIGADDVFVFTDAWKQSAVVLGSDCDLVTRMSWTYRRAVVAMSVTSFTTAIAFFLTATSPIMPISTLGFWAGLLILFQFFLVITIYPCAIIVWHRFFRVRSIGNCFKAPEEGAEKKTPAWQKCLPAKWRSDPTPQGVDEYRLLEKFFRGPWINIIRKGRYFILLLGTALVGASIYFATQLQPPQEEEQFLPKSHPLQRSVTALQDAFPRSDVDLQLQVKISWGVKDIDRTGTSKFTPEIPDPAKGLIFKGDTIDPVECWIQDFKDWRNTEKNKQVFEDYENGKALVDELIEFTNHTQDGRKPYLEYLDEQILFNSAQDRVAFTEVGFVSPTEVSIPFEVMFPVYEQWIAELDTFNGRGPEGANKAIATGDYAWIWQITQKKLVSSMFLNIGIMLAVAFTTLFVSSLSLPLALLATVTIGGIVSNLLGFIEIVGWQLGITETVAVVISVGYSFDGAAHLATAYSESRSVERFDRTRDALTDLGISILFGAVSTLLAGVMLFPAIIVFFVKFGSLLVATVVLSMVWTLFFFPALLVTFGPSGDFGSLKPFVRGLLSRGRGRARDGASATDGTDREREGPHAAEKVWEGRDSVVADESPFEYSA